jgi:hypothetical protein
MTDRPVSPLVIALVAFASPWVAPLPAQDFPPAPPLPVRFAQVEAPEPTLIGPALPGFQAPHPDDLLPADPSMAVPDADIEAFARGPVHQAFADVYELDPAPNVIVTVAPPAAVDELPPDQVPTGDNVQWIAGYWSWDEESKDYLWVSGVWRDVPPGRRWVPGYWAEVEGGFQFVSGFWTNVESQELAYLPQPPASLEVGPNVPPPSDDQVWVPGNWSYVSNNYQWSPDTTLPASRITCGSPTSITGLRAAVCLSGGTGTIASLGGGCCSRRCGSVVRWWDMGMAVRPATSLGTRST